MTKINKFLLVLWFFQVKASTPMYNEIYQPVTGNSGIESPGTTPSTTKRQGPPECPQGFIECGDICYTLTERNPFLPKCPFNNVAPFNYSISFMGDEITEPIWVPVTRDLTNGTGPLRWVEPSSLYQSEYTDLNVHDDKNDQIQNCLVYKGKQFEPVGCLEAYSGLCAYRKLNKINPTPWSWILTDELGSYNLNERENDEPEVKVELAYVFNTSQFSITITNFSWLQSFDGVALFCFTDASPKDLLYIYPFSELEAFSFEPLEFPGNYWCEAFNFSNLENIKTEKIFVRPVKNLEFVAIFEMVLPPRTMSSSSSDIVTFIMEKLSNEFDTVEDMEIKYVLRIMKIVDLDLKSNVFFVNVHFSSELELDPLEVESRYHSLQDKINQLFGTSIIRVANFSNSDYCINQTFRYSSDLSLAWPTTPINEETTPEQFCFLSKGKLVTALCTGNFMDGAQWLHSGGCKILQPSVVTESLLSLYHEPSTANDQNIRHIFEDYSIDEFAALDIFLIEEIYRHYVEKKIMFDLEVFGAVIDKILQIDKKILSESQITASVTDKFLNIFDHLLIYENPCRLNTSKFVLVVSSTNDLSGIVVESVNGNKTLTTIEGNWTSTRMIQEFKNLEFAVWLSPDLRTTIDKNLKIAMTLFFNDFFFSNDMSRNVSAVFGVLLQNTSQEAVLPGSIIVMQKLNLDGTAVVSCLTWKYSIDEFRGYWTGNIQHDNLGSYQVCNFWNAANFGVSFNTENVTDELEQLLEGSGWIASSEKIEMLESISEKYKKFQDVDVYLAGKVLEMMSYDSDCDLDMLAKTVNNFHRIDQKILSTSQQKNKATDIILRNVDALVKHNIHSKVLVTTDNFILFVSTLEETNFSGLLVMESNQSLKAEIVSDGFSVDDISSYDDFVSLIMFSPELKNQLSQNDKIIITIFCSGVLFNENQSKHKTSGKIFGVILPDIGNYSGPISIFHKISTTGYDLECSHWNYINTSFWKKDTSGKTLGNLTQCDFWHTTHFGLLLLENDEYEQYKVLDWITNINSAISLFGLFIIIVTAVLFQKWRRNIGNQILLNMSLAITLQIVMFFIAAANRHSSSYFYCTFIGILLQYSLISQFCWMLIIGVLQFRRFVKVFAPSPQYLLLKACILGWAPPVIPVTVSLILSNADYVDGVAGMCYPSGLALYLGILVPVAIIAFINLVIFIYIVYNVIRSNIESAAGGRSEGKYQWRLFVLLFFMLGLTWSFGFLSGLAVVFAYLFCFTATLQGFILFLYFIVFNANTRHMYVRYFNSLCSSKEY